MIAYENTHNNEGTLMRTRAVLIAAGALVIATSLVGCAGANNFSASPQAGSPTTAVQKGGTLTILTSATTVNLDPAKSWNLATTMLGLLDRRLTTWKIDPTGAPEVVGDLATDKGTPSEGGKVWTYTLKDGLKFSDGSPIRAQDIKYGIERTYTPELAGGIGYHKALLAGGDTYKGPYDGKQLASIETPNDKTIVFHLNKAYGDWPWIVSTTSTAAVPEGKAPVDTFATKPITSGPYQVESYAAGNQLVLTRNQYWDAATDAVRTAGPDKIVVEQGQDPTVEAQKLIANAPVDQNSFGADFVPAAQLALAQNNADAKSRLLTSDSGALEYLALNVQSPKLKDLRVRQALEYAIDRQAFAVAAGGPIAAAPATTLITPGIAGREEFDLYPAGESGDPAKAKQLLADAGVTSLNLTLISTNDDTTVKKAQAVQQAFAKAGIELTLKPEDVDTWTAQATGAKAGSYDISLSSWQPDYPSAASNIQPLFDSSQIGGGNYNVSRYSSTKVDDLIAQALGTTDSAAANQLWAQADKAILTDAAVVPIVYDKNTFLRGSGVQNFYIGAFPAYPVYPAVSLKQ